MPRTPRLLFMACILLPFAATGCVERNVEGNSAVYTFPTWLSYAVGAASLVLVPVGLLVLKWRKALGIILMIGGPLLAVFVAPSFGYDKVVVDPDHFELRTGFWFSPTQHNVRFDDVTSMTIREEVRYNRGRKNYSYYLDCAKKQGGVEAVPVGDVMKKAIDEITQRSEEKGIRVTEKRAE